MTKKKSMTTVFIVMVEYLYLMEEAGRSYVEALFFKENDANEYVRKITKPNQNFVFYITKREVQ
jgi:hypothetical protein